MVHECPAASGLDGEPLVVVAPIFHSVSVPGISAGDYLVEHLIRMGLARKEHLTEPMVLHMLCLLDTLIQLQAPNGFHLCTSNVHRVLLATMVLSMKLLDDDLYNNKYWATIGGVPLAHLNELEIHMASLLNHRLLVTPDAIDSVRERLLSSAA